MIFIKHLNKIMKIVLIMDSKGIFNVDLFISLTALLIIFSMILSVSTVEYSSIEETQNRRQARILVMDISDIMDEVYINGNGFSKKIELPEKINNETYILQINETGIYLNSHNQITHATTLNNIFPHAKNQFLKPGHVYEFSNINNTLIIIQNN